jgi:hypothetical protein
MGREVTLQHVLVLIGVIVNGILQKKTRKNDGRGSGIFNFTRNNKGLIIIDALKHYLIFQQEGHGGKLARWRARTHTEKQNKLVQEMRQE